MQRLELEVKPRDLGAEKFEGNLNELRKLGYIPAVIYGHGKPVSVAIDQKVFDKAIHNKAGRNALFTIKIGSENSLGIIKEIQRNMFTQKPTHIDFQRINAKEKIEMNVPVHTTGEAPGVKNSGGILETITREIRVRCLPDDIPASIDVDISNLELGHGVKIQDITPPTGVEFVTTGDHIVVNVVAPKIEEVVAPAAVPGAPATGAEPEVIAKGKKDEEGAAAAAPAAGGKPGAAPAAAAAAPAAKGTEKKK